MHVVRILHLSFDELVGACVNGYILSPDVEENVKSILSSVLEG